MMIPPHIIDTILSTARIEEVIGEFVQLKRAGSNLKGLSPFTDEKTPSFVVSPGKQIFKCFSTGIGGNVVSFLMEKEHYSYPEALRWLADKYHIEIPENRSLTEDEKEEITERESLFIINKFARDHFKKNLTETQEGEAIGLSYFLERGFRKDIVEQFDLGYCLSSGTDFTDAALQKGYDLRLLETVGLSKTKEERYFDFFRGRVMFPIHSVTGRILGFGGRVLRMDKKTAKYFNSPESIIYNKSDILYGLFFAKNDIIKYDNCLLVEGYTDVISMHQAGVKNVVSSSGTSLTKGQIKLIRRYTNNITILYDGDAAGIKASFRGTDLILEEGLTVQIVLFPDGDDPDSYSKKVSSEELMNYIEQSKQDFISFKSDLLLKEGQDDPIKKSKLIHDIIESISVIPDSVARSIYTAEIASRFDIDKHIVEQEIVKLIIERRTREQKSSGSEVHELTNFFTHQNKNHEPEIATVSSPTTQQKQLNLSAEKDLIRILMLYGAHAIETKTEEGIKEISVSEFLIYELKRDHLEMQDERHQKVMTLIEEGLQNNELFEVTYFLKNRDMDIVRLATEFETSTYELSHNWFGKYKISVDTELDKLKSAVYQITYIYKLDRINKRIEKIRTRLEHEGGEMGDEELMALLSEQVINEKIKTSLAEKLGRILYH